MTESGKQTDSHASKMSKYTSVVTIALRYKRKFEWINISSCDEVGQNSPVNVFIYPDGVDKSQLNWDEA